MRRVLTILALLSALAIPAQAKKPPHVDWNIEVDFGTDEIRAVVACDGEGGYGVALNKKRYVFNDATRSHEIDHILFLRLVFPQGCAGAYRGAIPRMTNKKTHNYVECMAYYSSYLTSRLMFPVDQAVRLWRRAEKDYWCAPVTYMAKEWKRLRKIRREIELRPGAVWIIWDPRLYWPVYIVNRGDGEALTYYRRTK